MKIEIEVVSTETIKPSSPTPTHLRHYQLSFLDQIAPPVFMPLIFFYPKNTNTEVANMVQDKHNHLKTALSKALALFYPLAGRVIDNLYVDCNDSGVPYVSARSSCQLSELLNDPNPNEFNKFIPYDLDDIRDLPAVIQVTSFACGGIALSLGMSHKVVDALSSFLFVNSWAAIARGDPNVPCPKFESATLFPPRNLTGFKPSTGIVKDKIVTKIFVFPSSYVAALREKYTNHTCNDKNNTRPTCIEALSAFIWSRFMASTQAKSVQDGKTYTVLHAVNLRTRMDPPVPENSFGNISRHAIAMAPNLGSTSPDNACCEIVSSMRDSLKKIDADYVRQLQEGEKHLNYLKERVAMVGRGEVVSLSFTSLCRIPMYEADFGWGKPIWVGSASFTFKNLVCFMDTRLGDGIEAWIHLKEEDMAKFEADEEVIAMVSTNLDGKAKACGV